MEQIIKKAIEGGYNKIYMELDFSHPKWKWQIKAIPLDPTFWQCLGKSLGWDNLMFCPVCSNGIGRDGDESFCEKWKYHWHKFINHLADGKSPNDFFTELLSANNE